MATTIIIPCPTGEFPPQAASLAAIGGVHVVLVGPGLEDGTLGRMQALGAEGGLADLLNAGLDAAVTEHVLLLGPCDTFKSAGLAPLLEAASVEAVAGAIGDFGFTSPVGQLPPRAARLPDTLGLDEIRGVRPIISAVLARRDAVADSRLRSDLACGSELDFVLRLADRGHRFSHCSGVVATRPMAPLTDSRTTLADLAAHIQILADVVPAGALPDAAADLIDAVVVLRAHQRAMADGQSPRLAGATRFAHLYAQWWHRCGLHGPAPRHVLEANGGVAEAVSTDPTLIARRILSMCPRRAVPVLLGLGRNARAVARELHAAGLKVRGRDDSGLPAWSNEDRIPVEVIPSSAPFDDAPHIMTVLHDDGFLAKVPKGVQVVRWRTTPDLILAEWRAAALDWALRARVVTEPGPVMAGATS